MTPGGEQRRGQSPVQSSRVCVCVRTLAGNGKGHGVFIHIGMFMYDNACGYNLYTQTQGVIKMPTHPPPAD